MHFLWRLAKSVSSDGMRICLLALAAMPALSTTVMAQQVKEPEFDNVFFSVGPGGDLVPLEQRNLKNDLKIHRGFMTTSTNYGFAVPGDASPIHVAPDARFIVKADLRGGDPANAVSLDPLTVRGEERVVISQKVSGNVFTHDVRNQSSTDKAISLMFKKVGKDSLEIMPAQPLPPGEYMLSTQKTPGAGVYCFSVGAK